MDRGLALKLGVPLVPIDSPFPVHSLDSRSLGSGMVRETTVPLDMVMQGNHRERISLYIIDSPALPVVLGIPWLSRHNTKILRRQEVLQGWSEECSGRCVGVSIGATSVESPDQGSSVCIPPEYADLAIAFSKEKATKLPPYRPGTDWISGARIVWCVFGMETSGKPHLVPHRATMSTSSCRMG